MAVRDRAGLLRRQARWLARMSVIPVAFGAISALVHGFHAMLISLIVITSAVYWGLAAGFRAAAAHMDRRNGRISVSTPGDGGTHMIFRNCDRCGLELEARYGPMPGGRAGQYMWCIHCRRGHACTCNSCRGTEIGPFRMIITTRPPA